MLTLYLSVYRQASAESPSPFIIISISFLTLRWEVKITKYSNCLTWSDHGLRNFLYGARRIEEMVIRAGTMEHYPKAKSIEADLYTEIDDDNVLESKESWGRYGILPKESCHPSQPRKIRRSLQGRNVGLCQAKGVPLADVC